MYIIKNDPYGVRLCKMFTQVCFTPSEDISQSIQYPIEEAKIIGSEGNLNVLKVDIFRTCSQINIWGNTEHLSHTSTKWHPPAVSKILILKIMKRNACTTNLPTKEKQKSIIFL